MDSLVIAYVPCIHAGYLAFFRKHGGKKIRLVILDVANPELDYIGRELMALEAHDVVRSIRPLRLFKDVSLADERALAALGKSPTRVVMPNEGVSHRLAEMYLRRCDITFDSVFLRWDASRVASRNDITADRTISSTLAASTFMRSATEEAEKSSDWWRHVGAIAVRNGKRIVIAHNRHLPSEHVPYLLGDPRDVIAPGKHPDLATTLHAEAGVVAEAARAVLSGSDLYVTTFPCPTCARIVAHAGVKRLFYREGSSALDAVEILKHYGIEIIHVLDV